MSKFTLTFDNEDFIMLIDMAKYYQENGTNLSEDSQVRVADLLEVSQQLMDELLTEQQFRGNK